MVKESFFVPFEGEDTELVRKGILSFTNDFGFQNGWLAVNVIENIEALSDYPGLKDFNKLIHKSETNINNFIFRRIIYKSTLSNGIQKKNSLPKSGEGFPLFAFHPRSDFLEKLDKIPDIPLMIVATWTIDEVKNWIDKNNAINLFQEKIIATVKKLDDKTENRIIQEFGHIPSNGLLENHLIRISEKLFNDLFDEGIDYDPMDIKDLLKKKLSFDEITADIPYEISDRIRSGQRNRVNN